VGRFIALVGLGALGLPVAVNAAPILRLTSGSTVVTVNDNGAGDTDARPGYIGFNGSVGTLAATLSAAGNSNSPGGIYPNSPSLSLGVLQLQTLEVRNNDTGRQTLDIVFGDTGFIAAVGNANNLSSSVGLTLTNATLGDSVSFQSHLNRSNTSLAFDPIFTTGPQAAVGNGVQPTQSYNSTNAVSVPGGSVANPLFSLTQHAVLSLSAGGQANLSATTASDTAADGRGALPEPGSLAFLGLGAMALFGRRRRGN
jgi:hypothetical protein